MSDGTHRIADELSDRPLSAAGDRWAIATPHVAATRAGAAAFEAGGNALDAALAAATTLSVVYPMMCGIGGDAFALVRTPGRPTVSVNSSGRSPIALDVDAIRATNETMPARGAPAMTVPGAVGGWWAIHELGARRPWAEAFARAIAYAADGAPVAPGVASSIAEARGLLASDAGARAVFLPGGRPLAARDTLSNPALARALEAIATGGPEVLYGGDVGRRYVDGLRAAGSAMSIDDLAGHRAELLAPLSAAFHGLRVLSSPPTSQGFVFLQALSIVGRLGLDPDPFGADAGRVARAFAASARERDAELADPSAMRLGADDLLSDERVERLATSIADGLPAASGPSPLGGTTGFVAADADGHAVSLIQSLSWGFGSGVLEPSTGILAQNRGSGFVLDRAHPNALGPGKRPAHTLMPVMAERDGRLAAVSGTMGGPAHPQINAWSLIRSLVLGTGAASAVSAPRWIAGGMDAIDGVVEAEADVPEPVVERIRDAGFEAVRLGRRDWATGDAHLIVLRDDGFDVGSDPRADGSALAS